MICVLFDQKEQDSWFSLYKGLVKNIEKFMGSFITEK